MMAMLAKSIVAQGRAEIPIAFANDRQRLGAKSVGLGWVARTTAALRDQTGRTRGPVGSQKPEYLTSLKPQQLRRRRGRQPASIQIPQHLEPRKLPIAHQPYRHPRHL